MPTRARHEEPVRVLKLRKDMSAAEVDALWTELARRLEATPLTTQPEVAARCVELCSSPDAGLREFGEAVRADPALSGRLLKLANSAFFAQREAITSVERACVVLGLERLKGVALGFYISRPGTGAEGARIAALSRRVWGESLYRACVATELARTVAPQLVAEAFLVGLLLDAGQSLVANWERVPALKIYESGASPSIQWSRELAELGCTHVDAAAAMAKAWKLPATLAKPIQRHHTPSAVSGPHGSTADPVQLLHAIGYYTGSLVIRNAAEGTNAASTDMPIMASRMLGLTSEALGNITRRASIEYSGLREMFSDVAEGLRDLTGLALSAHHQLAAAMDRQMLGQVHDESTQAGLTISIAGKRIDLHSDSRDLIVAYLVDGQGHRVVSHSVSPGPGAAAELLAALAIENASGQDVQELSRQMRLLAA